MPEPLSAAQAQAVDSARQFVRAWMRKKNLPGVSVAIGLDGKLVWAEGFGWADLEELTIFAADSLLFRPGTKYSYSSYGWNLVSAVVERAAGEPFLEFMRREVFAPIGMRHTVPDDVSRIVPDRASFYVRDSTGLLRNERYVDESNKWASGGFLSTPSDLVRFGFAMLDGGLLKPETVKLLWTPLRLESGESTGYGLGWFIRERGGHPVIASPGSSIGGKTVFVIFPEQRMVISVMSNVTGAEVPPIWLALAHFFGPARGADTPGAVRR